MLGHHFNMDERYGLSRALGLRRRRALQARMPQAVPSARRTPIAASEPAPATIAHERATSAIESSTIATCIAVSANSYHSPFLDALSPSSRKRSAVGWSCEMPCPALSGLRSL